MDPAEFLRKELLGFSRTDDSGENRLVLELRNRPVSVWEIFAGLAWDFVGICWDGVFWGAKNWAKNMLGIFIQALMMLTL